MDFEQGVTEHLAWKGRLLEYLARPDGQLNPFDVACDQSCTLGKWIQGESFSYAGYSEFATLRAEHAHFHQVVANIIRGGSSRACGRSA
jgi:Chemoreceptor zinc-binding domain